DVFESLRVAKSAAAAEVKSTAGVARPDNLYLTKALLSGDPNQAVPAFQGDVRFTMTVTKLSGEVEIDIDLAEMGATPRTLSNVALHINGKLEAAEVQTRIGRQKLESEPRTLTVGDRTITLPSSADRWALAIKGNSI